MNVSNLIIQNVSFILPISSSQFCHLLDQWPCEPLSYDRQEHACSHNLFHKWNMEKAFHQYDIAAHVLPVLLAFSVPLYSDCREIWLLHDLLHGVQEELCHQIVCGSTYIQTLDRWSELFFHV